MIYEFCFHFFSYFHTSGEIHSTIIGRWIAKTTLAQLIKTLLAATKHPNKSIAVAALKLLLLIIQCQVGPKNQMITNIIFAFTVP